MEFGAPFNAKYAFKLDQSLCELCDFVFNLKYMYNVIYKNVEKKCMGARGGQVKFHSEKCCGSPYDLLVISGV